MTIGTAASATLVPAPAQLATTDADERFLEKVRRAAAACGVTRLADITRLDRIGLPVWQAVRPLGRALSVHQGKGATPAAAQIGALCEAIESIPLMHDGGALLAASQRIFDSGVDRGESLKRAVPESFHHLLRIAAPTGVSP